MPSVAEQLEESRREIDALSTRMALLKEENRWLKQQLFGRSSEKRSAELVSPDQGRLLFNEAEALADAGAPAAPRVIIPAHARRKGGRKALPAELARIEVIHDLAESEKRCAHDGAVLERIGEECSEQLDYIPAQLRVIRHVRLKYACPCCHQGVKLAPVPAQLLPKSNASPALLAHIATAKYVDGLPLHRQERQFARLGIELGRASMASWMIKLGARVVPIINLLNDQLLESPLVHMDETRVQVLKSEKAPTAEHWMWVRAAGPPGRRIVLFDYDPSRGGHVPRRLLEGYRGILLSDGYEAYDVLARSAALVHAGCMAHARRRFEDARKVQSNAESRAAIALDYIGQLYAIERSLKEREPAEKLALRQERSAPLMARLHDWLLDLAPQVLPQSALGKAVHYALKQWPKLSVFLEYPVVPLDNNRCENAIRPFVTGEKILAVL